MATFYCQQYPEYTVKLAKDLIIHFEGGKFITNDEQTIELLRKYRMYGSIISEGKPAAWVSKALVPIQKLEERFTPAPKKAKKQKPPVRDEEDEELSHLFS